MVVGCRAADVASTEDAGVESSEAAHTRAVELARAGRYDEGLAILYGLLARYPDEYPLQRDTIVILTSKGDCPEALRRFERIRYRDDFEPYLVIPVADCLLAAARPKEAAWIVRRALARHPGHQGLEHAYRKARVALTLAGLDETRPEARMALVSDESERGPREWRLEAEGEATAWRRARASMRVISPRARADEAAYAERGEIARVALGLRYRFDERRLLAQEISRDLGRGGQGAARTALTFEPRDTLRYELDYTNFAEDLALRARAAGVESDRLRLAAEWRAADWRWEGFAAASRYEFSDGNERTALYATHGYAWSRRPEREQRILVEVYQSRNTLGDSRPYYNPRRDRDLGLVHRTDFAYDTRFKRHVDRLSLLFGSYWQAGFGSHSHWGGYASNRITISMTPRACSGRRLSGAVFTTGRARTRAASNSPGGGGSSAMGVRLPTMLLLAILCAAAEGAEIPAIAYHDIVEREGGDPSAVTRAAFLEQMAYLRERGYTPVSLAQLEAARRARAVLPPRPVLLTFDDGLESFRQIALPVLTRYGYPAVLSVVTAWADGHGIPPAYRGRVMSWPALREVARSPLVEVISHSHDLHRTIPSNPQGNEAPAGVTRRYDASSGATSPRRRSANVFAPI